MASATASRLPSAPVRRAGGVGGERVEGVGVGAQALAGGGERAIEVGALAAQQRQDVVAQAAAAIGAIVVGRIAHDVEGARGQVGLDVGARHGEQRAHQPEVAPDRSDAAGGCHRAEAAGAGAADQAIEQRLGLVAGGVADGDGAGAGAPASATSAS